MLVNLNIPYSRKIALPHQQEFVFYTKANDDMLFEGPGFIEIYCRTTVRTLQLIWDLYRNVLKKSLMHGQGEALPAYTWIIRIPCENLLPGFYDVRVRLGCGGGSAIEGICTFGYRVKELQVRLNKPENFKQFWKTAMEKLSNVPLAPREEYFQTFTAAQIEEYNITQAGLPGNYDPEGAVHQEVEAYRISYASVNGIRIHGWLAKPKGKGPFPAMIIYPGAGFNSRSIPLEHARRGYLALDIQIHGQEVDQKAYEEIPGYISDYRYEPPEDNYFYCMYLHGVQAVSYILSRGDADPDRIVTTGGSQGGRLSLVAAALDKRVKAVVAAITHFANIAHIEWSKRSNGDYIQDKSLEAEYLELLNTVECRCKAYYDAVNFAPEITCPVLMNAGLVDPVSPPMGVFSAYQLLASEEKRIIALPGLGHDWSAEFDRMAWKWLKMVLKM